MYSGHVAADTAASVFTWALGMWMRNNALFIRTPEDR